jgi:epoxyqueuosine reductase
MSDARLKIESAIADFVRASPLNRLQHIDGSPIFDAPLVGVADGDDPLFEQYKSIIGPFHLTPREAITYAAGSLSTEPAGSGLSVVCWVLPIARETRLSNRRETRVPSRRWAHTRWFGEQFNDALRQHVVRSLQAMGHVAIAPVVSPLFRSLKEGVARPPVSTWSERHILYAAGMGTFSLNEGLITPRGMAMRCGSVVTNLPLPPDPRTASNHLSNCLFHVDRSCRRCIERCPAGALSEQGHDKLKCESYSYGELKPLRDEYGVGVTGCGLCQVRVPCEDRIPSHRGASKQ